MTQLVVLMNLQTGDTIAREMTPAQIFEAIRDGYMIMRARG